MLQYSAQPIPLPGISYKPQLARKDILPDHRPTNDSSASRLFNKRFTKDRPLRPSPVVHHAPLPPSDLSPLPSPLPLPTLASPPPPSPLALPSLLPASSSRRPRLPSAHPPSSRHSTSGSSFVEDVLAPGDIIGEGILLQDHHIHLSPAPVSQASTDFGLAKEFEVVRKLGTGSYAVVYLVREVLSRTLPSEDGHCGALDLGDTSHSTSYVTYGRDFALKCLSKANLDQDALAAQMSEVSPISTPSAPIFIPYRSLSISLFAPIPTSSPSIAPLRPPPSSSSS